MKYLTHEDELQFTDNTVFYFYATWMPFHKKLVIMIEKVPDFQFIAIDTDYFPKLTQRFQVDSVPTFLTFQSKKVINKWTGVTHTKAFVSHFTKLKKP